jgi:RNA polymerase sigma factor (sigma-70 family)
MHTGGGLTGVVRHLRHQCGDSTNDGELLARFAGERDESAFAELVRRHGGLVLGVARRQLADREQAEDVFQATFLALARQAARLGRPPSLVNWLYTVALRQARKTRLAASRRATRDARLTPPPPSADPLAEVSGRELVALIDEELARLPEAYRLPLLLCGLHGLGRDEAARRLGWTAGAVKGRLERGRELLRKRLEKRGLAVPAVLAAALAADGASAAPPELVRTITRAALAVPAAAGSLKVLLPAVILVAALGIGVGVTTLLGQHREAPAAPPPPAAPEPAARLDALGDPLPEGAVARLGSLRLRPGSDIEALAFSPDGAKLACWGGSHFQRGQFTLWDVATGRLLRRVDLPRAQVKLLHWLPDGRGCAVVRVRPEEYAVWDFADESATVPQVPDRVGLNVHADGHLLAVAVSPDGRRLATGRLDAHNRPHAVEIHELAVNKPLRELPSRALGIVSGHCVGLLFTPDSRTLLALGRTQEPDQGNAPIVPGKLSDRARLVAWDVATGRERVTCDVGAPGAFSVGFGAWRELPRSFALTPDGQTLVIGQQDGSVHLWDWPAGRERRSWVVHPPGDPKYFQYGGVAAVAVSGDGKTLFTGGLVGPRRFWDLASGREVGSAPGRNQFHAVAVSPDGKRLTTGGNDGQIVLLDFATRAEVVPLPGHRGWVERVFVAPDGRTARTAGTDGTVCRWDLATGRELGRAAVDIPCWFWPTAFTQDGRGLIGQNTSSVEVANETYLWDTDTGRGQPLAEAFTATSRSPLTPPVAGAVLVLDRGDRTVTLRDWPSGRLRHTFAPPAHEAPANGHSTLAAALAPDGRLAAVLGRDILSTGDSTLYATGRVGLFNAVTGRVTHRWSTPHAYFDRAAFTPDGAGLIVGGYTLYPVNPRGGLPRVAPLKAEQALQLLDVEAGEPVRTFLPPGIDQTGFRYITALAVSPDSRQLAAAERDYTIWLYEIATGQARRRLVGHANQVTALAFTPDGRRLVSTSRDLTGLVWDVSLAAITRAGAEPTPADLDRLWTDLAKPVWGLAGPALATLAAHPEAAVGLLRDRLRPDNRPAVDVAAIDRLVRQLDSRVFAERERALAELRRLDLDALPHLRRRAAETTSAEVRQRLAKLLQDFAAAPLPPERLRELRAVELLEQTATPAAREQLRALAGGGAGARLTEAAADALQRLDRR